MNENTKNGSNELPNEIKLSNENDSNPIFDIISTLQSKLNNNTEKELSSNTNKVSNTNENKEENSFDMSKLNSILSGLNQNDESSNTSESNSTGDILSSLAGLNIDMSTILRFQKIFSKFNQDDPRKNFLTSLKPFLRETRRKNLDTYIILIALADAFDIFGKKTGGE